MVSTLYDDSADYVKYVKVCKRQCDQTELPLSLARLIILMTFFHSFALL